ncbi:MAG: ATP-dependent endonuclease [Marinilabiliales bacterium]|nr:MAG: ATP-dependent endonuclease [Marinilabiliales bacterium]
MNSYEFESQFTTNFKFVPTSDQKSAINHISRFNCSLKTNPLYILKGYAGTGKTSILGAYVKTLDNNKIKTVLLAPTGRAAKVLSSYTLKPAHTIHRYIYFIVTGKNGYPIVQLQKNKLKNTVFIVDEASMISDSGSNDEGGFGGHSLLDDLVEYVFSNQGNKLILVGDTAQLPPVGLNLSPALDINYLKSAYNITAHSFEMKEVMRQSLDSGILNSATTLRIKLTNTDASLPLLDKSGFKNDVKIIDSAYEFEEILQDNFNDAVQNNSVLICRTNKRANIFNEQIRKAILLREEEIEAGDRLMIVKNNYFWLDENSKAGFIANGEMIDIIRINKLEDVYGFRFAEAEIRLIDYPDEKEITVKLLLDTIMAEGPGLSLDQRNSLFEAVLEDYSDAPTRGQAVAQVMINPFFNALHIKFAYAMTCHKTQGGQWPTVIIDQGWLSDEMLNTEFLRWLYTAFTRATENLFLINFKEDMFG